MTGKERIATEEETIRAVRDGLVLFAHKMQDTGHDSCIVFREIGICVGKLIEMATKTDRQRMDACLMLFTAAMAGSGLPVDYISESVMKKAVALMPKEGNA
jgi:hypothetical protein